MPDGLTTLLVALPVCLLLRFRPAACQFIGWGALGFLWAVFCAGSLAGQVERLSRGPEVTAVVQVVSVTLTPAAGKQTLMRIERINGRWLAPSIAFTTVWQTDNTQLCAGQRWQLRLRLRPVHGKLNEGGFDSQRWAMAQRQPLTALVKTPSCWTAAAAGGNALSAMPKATWAICVTDRCCWPWRLAKEPRWNRRCAR